MNADSNLNRQANSLVTNECNGHDYNERTPFLPNPAIQQSSNPLIRPALPWPEPVNGAALLDELAAIVQRFVILPRWAAETLALWIIHTYAFELRDVSTYIGIESPEKRCGKTTLLGVLSKLVNRPVVASNISPSAFFRVIEETRPTLLIDEADTFLQGNDEIRGILNAGYHVDTSYVIRVRIEPSSNRNCSAERRKTQISELNTENCTLNTSSENPPSARPSSIVPTSHHSSSNLPSPSPLGPSTINSQPSTLVSYSCFCPKVIAAIGRLPETLADRCIVIRMQRKRGDEECERLRNLDSTRFRRQCARFVLDHQTAIQNARPQIPEALNDRAADIWEPLLALAELAGGAWPDKARAAAVGLTTGAHESSPSASLLFDIMLLFFRDDSERMFTHDLVTLLNSPRFAGRPWTDARKGKEITEIWLAQQLRPYGARPKLIRLDDRVGRGYDQAELLEIFRRYIPRSEIENWKAENPPPPKPEPPGPGISQPPIVP